MADHTLDGALLDIRLRGETSFPLADVLAVLGIPFVFVSGLSSALMPYTHRDRPLFDKPYDVRDVIATLARLLQPAARAAPTTARRNRRREPALTGQRGPSIPLRSRPRQT